MTHCKLKILCGLSALQNVYAVVQTVSEKIPSAIKFAVIAVKCLPVKDENASENKSASHSLTHLSAASDQLTKVPICSKLKSKWQ